MDNIIIKKGKAVGTFSSSTAIPLGVEYEQLVKNLNKEVQKKYDALDLREQKHFSLDQISNEQLDDKKTMMLLPGMLVNYENPQSDSRPYPQSDVPYSDGIRWSD